MSTEQTEPGFKEQNAGYQTWGSIQVLQQAERVSDKEYALREAKPGDVIISKIHSINSNGTTFFDQIFSSRKKINTILVTRQQYASQLKTEVPAILDDQAQLLGISIRMAANETDILKALRGRFAAVLSDGRCVCIGSSTEDARVAGWLLEKTAKVFIEAKHLGGAKAINKIEAWFMQQYYLFKYSKEAVKNK